MPLLWKILDDINQVEEITVASEKKPLCVFKHSTRCSISSMSKDRLERKWDAYAFSGNLDMYYLDLIKYRNISNLIADQFHIHHESPQLILIYNKESVYDASHNEINCEDLYHQVQLLSK